MKSSLHLVGKMLRIPGRLLEFPAEAYLRFFLNHGLLTPLGPPRWRTVVGGSHSYIKALERRFQGEFRRGHPVTAVRRDESGFEVECQGWQRFDAGVLAVHADQALALLSDPTEQERELLGAWRYQANQAVLHTDESMLPRQEKARASWNYLRSSLEDRATLTYDMNRLQGLYTVRRYLVTINPLREIDPDLVHGRWTYHHPQYDTKSMDSQAHLPGLSGVRGTYYCGSYFGFGFHEDAVRSAVQAAGLLGVNL